MWEKLRYQILDQQEHSNSKDWRAKQFLKTFGARKPKGLRDSYTGYLTSLSGSRIQLCEKNAFMSSIIEYYWRVLYQLASYQWNNH